MSEPVSQNPYDAPRSDVGLGDLPGRGAPKAWTAWEALLFGFKLTFRRPIAIAAGLIFAALCTAMALAQYVLLALTMLGARERLHAPDEAGYYIGFYFGLCFFSQLLVLPLQAYLIFGLLRLSLALARGRDAGLEQLLATTHFAKFLGAYLIFYVVVSVGVSFCFAPGVFVFVAFAPFALLICDSRAGALASFSAAWDLTQGHRWNLLLYFLLCIPAILAGSLALCVGIFVVLPAICQGFCFAYLKMCGEEPVGLP
jgi:hypothetical protein